MLFFLPFSAFYLFCLWAHVWTHMVHTKAPLSNNPEKASVRDHQWPSSGRRHCMASGRGQLQPPHSERVKPPLWLRDTMVKATSVQETQDDFWQQKQEDKKGLGYFKIKWKWMTLILTDRINQMWFDESYLVEVMQMTIDDQFANKTSI